MNKKILALMTCFISSQIFDFSLLLINALPERKQNQLFVFTQKALNEPSQPLSDSKNKKPQAEADNNTLIDWLNQNLKQDGVIYLLITTGISAIAWKITNEFQKTINKQKDQLKQLRQESEAKQKRAIETTKEAVLNSLFIPEELAKNEKRNSIIIVGMGGTGKTTLINRLFEEDQANPNIATKTYKVYRSTSEDSLCYKYNYYIADYMGQNIGTLIAGLMQEQKRPYSPMTLGAINSIICVVDLAKPAQAASSVSSVSSSESEISWKERVKYQIKQWSPTALDAIFGLVTSDSLRYVCLFINKIDLFNNLTEEEIIEEYKELINNLEMRSRGWMFESLIGSAKEGTKVPYLKSSLKKHSVSKE